jgi:signal transduction histidine kinase
MIDDIVDDLEISIHQKEARIEKADLPIIKGYPILLHQLFYNLFNNSLKFSKPDVKPLIKISAKHLESKQMIEIVVKDNGIGFHPRYNEEIFKTFIRLYSKDHFEGTGLGLSLCKKIVERHGGTIIANSEEGKGAEFTITLPML